MDASPRVLSSFSAKGWWALFRLGAAVTLALLLVWLFVAAVRVEAAGDGLLAAPPPESRTMAGVWYVSPAGNDANDCQSAATACRTVGGAMGKAASGDTIQIAAGTYTERITVTKSLVLQGAGAGKTILDANRKGRVVQVNSGLNVTLRGLTIRNGQVDADLGAGIYNGGALTLEDSEVLSNTVTADRWSGGGIYSWGTLTVVHTLLANNSAGFGGAVAIADASATAHSVLQDSMLRDNTATTVGGALFANGGIITIQGTTLSGNQSASSGAIHAQGNTSVTIVNATISGNRASQASGVLATSSVTMNFTNSTVAGNQAISGGSVQAILSYGVVTLKNTILANVPESSTNCSAVGSFNSLGHNLSDDSTCNLAQTTDFTNTEPHLGPLTDNGGWAFTQALLNGSPAIDAGDNNGCPATDQRGFSRPYDGDGDGTATCDIGAVEFRRQISVADVTITEGDSGTLNALFVVTLAPTTTQAVSVSYATVDGTATAGSDYQAASGTLVFGPGEGQKSISVAVVGDTVDEPDETFSLVLSNAQGADITDGQAVATIVDNDGLPSLTINDASVTEGNSGTAAAVFTVSLSPASGQVVSVQYATADGTATAGQDYTATSGTLTFNPGETSKNITVTVQGDLVDEGSGETFTVNLSNAVNATLYDVQGLGNITDDDTAVLRIGDSSVTEGDSGTTPSEFVVSLSQPSAFTVTVDFTTKDGAAIAGQDYVPVSGTLTFAPGVQERTVTVQVLGDTLDEPTEHYYVNLSNARNSIITDNSAQGYIQDDDGMPRLTLFSPQDTLEGDAGTQTVNFTVMLAPSSTQTVSVTYAITSGTATAGQDFTAAMSGVLRFNPGETYKVIPISIVGDTIPETDETIGAELSNPVNASIDIAQRSFAILDDDSGIPKLSITAGVEVPEGDSGVVNAVFTVTLNQSNTQNVTVQYATADGTATAGQDYTAASGTLTFSPGETQKRITVTVQGDTQPEPDETFLVNLSNPSGAVIAVGQSVGTIRNDDPFILFLPLVIR